MAVKFVLLVFTYQIQAVYSVVTQTVQDAMLVTQLLAHHVNQVNISQMVHALHALQVVQLVVILKIV